MKNELALNPADFNLDENKAKSIEQAFAPKIKEREGYVEVYKQLLTKEINEETCKEAGDLRRKLVKVRTGIAAIHKTEKAFSLAYSKFCDAWKNKETLPITQMEERLSDIEKYFELQEQKRLEELQAERVNLLSHYVEDAAERDLSLMEEDVWEAYFTSKKQAWEEQQAAIKEAEEARIEAERINKLRSERKERVIHLWNYIDNKVKESDFAEIENFEDFVKELEGKKSAYDKEQEAIRKENERLQKEAEAKEKQRQAELKAQREKEEKEREEREAKAEAERKRIAEKEAKLKAEKEEAERKLREAKEAEAKRLADEEKARQAELNKDDAAKVKDLINDLEALKTKYTFKSEKNKKKYAGVGKLIDKVVNYINE